MDKEAGDSLPQSSAPVEPEKCVECGSVEKMDLETFHVEGRGERRGWRCDECGHVHLVKASEMTPEEAQTAFLWKTVEQVQTIKGEDPKDILQRMFYIIETVLRQGG